MLHTTGSLTLDQLTSVTHCLISLPMATTMYSLFGEKFSAPSAISRLMNDLNDGVRGEDLYMLGGGNPAAIPEMVARIEQLIAESTDNHTLLDAVINYDGPQGKDRFREAIAQLLATTFGWQLSAENIALTNGSQTAFFYLHNIFGGQSSDGFTKQIVLPLCPEYIGYTDVAVEQTELFKAYRPQIELLQARQFKYHPNFDEIVLGRNTGLVCCSRPTNPTGNVLTDKEVSRLDAMCRDNQVPLLIDNAYGAPFPNILFESVTPIWNDNIILCLSLSKLGLPGVRCGIVVANTEVIRTLANLGGVANLAPSGIGPALVQPLVSSGELLTLSNELIRPYYQGRVTQVIEWLQQAIPNPGFRIHKPEGAIFLWLWFEGLSISAEALYQKLKQRGVIVVPGHAFYPGLDQPWHHKQECIRLSYTQPLPRMKEAIEILAETVAPYLD